jgi:hypothetical protein
VPSSEKVIVEFVKDIVADPAAGRLWGLSIALSQMEFPAAMSVLLKLAVIEVGVEIAGLEHCPVPGSQVPATWH